MTMWRDLTMQLRSDLMLATGIFDPVRLRLEYDAYLIGTLDLDYQEEPNEYKEGGSIHINPANKGKFNATKKRTGKTTEELTHSKNPITRKRAIFAQNAKKWHHKDDGGYLDDIIWDNMGLWSHPGLITGITGTKDGTDITMNGVADYLIGKDNLGNVKFMKPGMDYHFPGSSVVEYPLKYQFGGLFKKKETPNYLYTTYGLNSQGNATFTGSYNNPIFGYQTLSGINQSIGRDYSMPDYNAVRIVSEPIYDHSYQGPRQMDLVDLKNRQLFAESRGNERAKSPRGASGLYQIMPDTALWYADSTGNKGSVWDPAYNEQIRDWLMERLYNYDWAKSAKTDEERWRRAYAGYNWGSGNMSKVISKYGDDWYKHAPKETRDYVTFIIDNMDVGKHTTNEKYNEAKKTNKYFKQYGGLVKPFSYTDIPVVRYGNGGNLFQEDNSSIKSLSIFDKWRNYMQDNTIDVPITFRLPEVQVTAQAPKPGAANYDRYIANTYDAWLRGDVDINTLPIETRNRVRGYNGTIAAQKGMDTAAKVAGITAAIPTIIIGGISAAPTVWNIMNNPFVNAVLTIHGAITAPRNIKEGVQELQEGNYGRGALDLGLTALDLYGTGNLAYRLGRIANPAYRAKHAYNTIAPASYKNMSKRGKEWLKDLWNNPDIDYSNPKWYLKLKEDPLIDELDDIDVIGYTRTGTYLPGDVLHSGKIADEARMDAWALYNGLPQQHGTYIKNADGTYSYNMKKIMLDSEGTWYPGFEPSYDGEKSRMRDFVTGAGGGLTDFRLLESGEHGNGIMHLEDVWDLHPFSRQGMGDTFAERFGNKAIEKFGSQTRRDAVLNFRKKMFDKGVFGLYGNKGIQKITYPIDRILNRYRSGEFAPKFKVGDHEQVVGLFDKAVYDLSHSKAMTKLSDKLKDFEIGRISGGKPFKMSTDIPYHKRGLEDYLINSETAPSIASQEDLIRILRDEPLRYGFNPNWIANTKPLKPKFDFIESKIDFLNLLSNIYTKK